MPASIETTGECPLHGSFVHHLDGVRRCNFDCCGWFELAASSEPQTTIQFQRTPSNPDLPLPAYATDGAAGFDLRACISQPVSIGPGGRVLIGTGFCVALPVGHELQVRPRSGLAVKYGITVLNTPGTVDPDYRGEIKVPLINHSDEWFEVNHGDRIAQAVLAPVVRATMAEVVELDATVRGVGGFGSTGVA